MTIDIQWLGYGAGLVMVGYLSGMIVNVILSGIRSLRG